MNDPDTLPDEVREKLAELDLELSEGDITKKGYDKKRDALLAPFKSLRAANALHAEQSSASPNSRSNRRNQRRVTQDDDRYHSEIRVEAVHQALAEYSDGRKLGPQPVKPHRRNGTSVSRSSSAQKSKRSNHSGRRMLSDSSSEDEDSVNGGTLGRKDSTLTRPPQTAPRTASLVSNKNKKETLASTSDAAAAPPPPISRNTAERRAAAASGGGTRKERAVEDMLRLVQENRDRHDQQQKDYGEYVQARIRPKAPGGEVIRVARQDYRNSKIIVTDGDAIRISPHREEIETTIEETTSLHNGHDDEAVYVNTTIGGAARPPSPNEGQDYQNAVLPLKQAKVSSKIQNVVNALQRPRSKPLQDYYNDDDAELEAMAKIRDPDAPRPEGTIMNPVRGEAAHSNTNNTMPRSLDSFSAFHRFGTTAAKNIAAMVLDQSAKPSTQLTYGKLHSRAGKVAYMLLTKTVQVNKDGSKNVMCKPGDRVALIYPNTQPLHFLAAFYGCLQAGVIPVPVEMPSSKREAGIAQLGFLLGNCGVKVALTSESCYKGLPKKVNTSSTFSAPSGSNSLTGTSSEIVDFRGWPRLWWAVTEHMSKPSRDWTAPPRLADETIAYIEYTTGNDGTVKGCCVTRQAVFAHCRALTTAMEYKEDETMVCVVDFKREVGLWHAILASIFNGMKVIFVPYSLMKMNPATWMHMVSKYQATTALVKSRDLHWALLATRDHKDISLASLRTLLVADGANPWSLSSCDAFAAAFTPSPYSLRPDAMCPCAGSSETGTISIRRRGNAQLGSQSGRGILSMSALSHCVVRVDTENSLTSLTLQDAGQIVAGAVVVVTAIDGSNRLCQADEIGEICVSANSTAQLYWALDGQTHHTFKVEPVGEYGKLIGAVRYVRSGLIGFMGPDGMVFVVARRQSLLAVSGRYHSADDIIATVLAVEPMKFVYRGRICVFSTSVLRDERIVIVAEQKPNCSEEEAFDWITRVLRAIDTIHQVGIYCCALVPANHLPKTPLGGVHVSETKQRFENGDLHPSTLLMCPHNCVLNLPKPRERQADVGPAAMFVGNIVQGVRIAVAKGRNIDDEPSLPLLECLRSRAQSSPDHRILTLVTSKNAEQDTATCSTLLKRAERIAGLLTDRARLSRGDHVALIFPPSIDLVAAFFGCLSAGLVPVCIKPPVASDLNTTLGPIRMMVDMSKAVAILAPQNVSKLLKSKEAAHSIDSNAWPMILDLEDAPSSWRRKNNNNCDTTTSGSSGAASKEEICYLDFSINSSGQLQGSSMSEASAITVCKSIKVSSELYPSRHVVVCAPPYSGISLVLWCLSSVYSGHHTTLIPPMEVEQQPSLFLTTLSNLKVRDAFTTYSTINTCVTQLATSVENLRERGCNLSMLRSCVAIAEERPRIALMSSFCKLFAPLALNNRAISTSFSSRVNAAICMQGASGPEPSTVYVDARALRNDRISLVGKGAPHSVALIESGKLLPGVKIAIANPETRGQCADSHLGEIWVASIHNASPLNRLASVTGFGDEGTMNTDVYNARLTTGDTKTRWARTGYLGFLRQTQSITEHGELHDAVFVVGALNESLVLRGMRYHPFDVESTVSKAHRFVGNSAVFTWNHLVVIAAECTGSESDALDLVPAITSAVLEEHHLIVGVVVVVDPGSIRHGPGGEKLRSTIRSLFLEEKLNPIYVAYHM
ncbi:DMAP1-binding domain-containing protein [Caenorhabditis elegans]|uniref:DMAP1-binding domain-containing protein n=2 Tax=Caenorhabditis elegans TaxID=6239 RepID=A0A061AD00_CAEEL|nr:DMAP1-binding domain-containing protein [Caenorhabditis elegans]CDR32765.1 DMAP1-binding domain-containing protein [Caenorhabditis elegans]|eukprot:NP_001293298.1 Disco-Interacting Protein 2 homolog [Caenorhabditis elegans]